MSLVVIPVHLLLASALVAACAADSAPASPRALRVLFVGNSFTYYHNTPAIVEMLGAAGGRPIQATLIASGGVALADHAADSATRAAIAQGWDVVVLQEQSTLGATLLVDGKFRVESAERYRPAVRALAEAARSAGAEPVLFLPWTERGLPPRDQDAVTAAVVGASRELGAKVAPIAQAWQLARRMAPDVELYDPDGLHPSPAGSYLNAAVLYAVLTGADPLGLPGRAAGAAVEQADGRVFHDSTVTLVALPTATAAALQRAAREAIATASAGLTVPDVTPVALPRIERGRVPTADELTGRWRGSVMAYPLPGKLDLDVTVDGSTGAMLGLLAIDFDRPSASIAKHRVSVALGDAVEIVDPDGPNGGAVRYRGVMQGDSLAGVAEFVGPGGERLGIGRWTVRRVR